MAHPFEIRKQIEVAAAPDQVWEAIATGAGIDGWFLGTGNAVEPRLGGTVHLDFGEGGSADQTITEWDPPHRLAYGGTEPAPDGSLHAFQYVLEGRAGTTHVRLVHSGFLADDWEAEYDAVNEGDFMYLHLLAQYVTHFAGRATTVVTLWRGDEPDRARALAAFRAGLGLGDAVALGEPVHAAPDGLPAIDGEIDFVSPGIIGVRTGDALLRFLHSPQGVAYLGHHLYAPDADPVASRAAWQAWLDRAFAAASA